jgi:hypothetical protein
MQKWVGEQKEHLIIAKYSENVYQEIDKYYRS